MADRKIQRSITIDPDLLKYAERIAGQTDRSVSYLIERALKKYLPKAISDQQKGAA